eukprot:g19388.t2
MIRFSDVVCGGEKGQFRANSESVGWQGASGATKVQPAAHIRRAEWFEGSLRLLCEDNGATEVLALEGFRDADFDPLWKYLEQTCGVYLKKHKPKAALEEADFDSAMQGIEDAADRVDETVSGSVQKKAKEADLMKKVECVRDGLDQAVSGDKQALSRVFAAGGCERIGRLRLVVDTVQLEVYHTDPRWQHLLSKCATIEAVLKELGTFRQWKPAEGHSESLLRRAMVRELRHRQGEDDEVPPVAETIPSSGHADRGYVAEARVDVPLPSPVPMPAAEEPLPEGEVERVDSEEDVANVFHEEAEPKQVPFKDEEVSDPNSVRADALDQSGGRPLRYTHPNSILEGWVWKRSRILKRWRRRWVVLCPGELMSFKNRGLREPTEVVPAGTVLRVYSADGEVAAPVFRWGLLSEGHVTVALGRFVFRTSSQRPPLQLSPAERCDWLKFSCFSQLTETSAQVTESNQQIIGLVRRGFDRPVLQPFTSTAKRVAESVCGRDVQSLIEEIEEENPQPRGQCSVEVNLFYEGLTAVFPDSAASTAHRILQVGVSGAECGFRAFQSGDAAAAVLALSDGCLVVKMPRVSIIQEEGDKKGKDPKEEDEDEEAAEGSNESLEDAESEEPKASDAEDEGEANLQSNSQSYLPPHLRGRGGDNVQSFQRTLRGTLNRVSEGNLDPSCQEIVKVLSQMIPETGTAKAADAFTSALLSAAVEDPNISVLVLGCFAALVGACHVTFGSSFGAAALLKCLDILQIRMGMSADHDPDEATNTDARIAKNCIIFTMLLFSFGILPGSVVFDVVRYVLKRPITEVSVELSLTLLRYAGRQLRSDCPEDFREVLRFVTSEAEASRSAEVEAASRSGMQSRLDYLLKELNDLKNNKVSFAVMDRFNQTRGWLQSAPLLKGRKVSEHILAVPFRVLHDEVPSNWPLGVQAGESAVLARSKSSGSNPLREAAIAQRLTSELRQNLFVALMGAEDFEDAVERVILAAGAAKNGHSEACVVLFHCAIREKKPNAFYAHVAQSLCNRPAPVGKRFSHSMKRAAVQHIQTPSLSIQLFNL